MKDNLPELTEATHNYDSEPTRASQADVYPLYLTQQDIDWLTTPPAPTRGQQNG